MVEMRADAKTDFDRFPPVSKSSIDQCPHARLMELFYVQMEFVMAEKPPSFQFYPKDILSDSSAMLLPNEIFGIYMKLLCHDWINDGLPDNDEDILSLGNFDWYEHFTFQDDPNAYKARSITQLRQFFIKHPEKDGYITNSRLLKERQKQKDYHEKKVKAGSAGGIAKAQKTPSKTVAKRSSSSASSFASSSSSSKNKEPKPIDHPKKPDDPFIAQHREYFEKIWEDYPEKKGKEKAWVKFRGQVTTDTLFWGMCKALDAYKAEVARCRDNGQPNLNWQHGSTWFNHSWKDYVDFEQAEEEQPWKPKQEVEGNEGS